MKNRQQVALKTAPLKVRTQFRRTYSIGAATPYDLESKNLTGDGGLLPVTTKLERLGFQQLIGGPVVFSPITVRRFTNPVIRIAYFGERCAANRRRCHSRWELNARPATPCLYPCSRCTLQQFARATPLL